MWVDYLIFRILRDAGLEFYTVLTPSSIVTCRSRSQTKIQNQESIALNSLNLLYFTLAYISAATATIVSCLQAYQDEALQVFISYVESKAPRI